LKKKYWKEKTRRDPAGRPDDPVDLKKLGQKPGYDPLTFVFFY